MLGRSDPQIDASGCFKPMADCEGMYLRVGATRAMQFLSKIPGRHHSPVTSDDEAHLPMSAALPPSAVDQVSYRTFGADGGPAPDFSTNALASGDVELERAKQGFALAQQ